MNTTRKPELVREGVRRIPVRVTDEQWEMLRGLSYEDQTSMTEVATRLLVRALASERAARASAARKSQS